MNGSEPSAVPPPPRRPRLHPPGTVTVRCRLDGPLVVELAADLAQEGVRIRVTDHDDREVALPDSGKPALALCRCGHSRRRPFCDGSHVEAGFRSARAAGDGDQGPPADPPPGAHRG